MVKESNNYNSGLTKYQIQELRASVEGLQKDMRTILENYLPHLKEDNVNIKTRINVYTAINIGAIILTLLFERFIK